MSIIEPVRRYFRRREAEMMIQVAHKVSLLVQEQAVPLGSFVFPGMDYVAMLEVDGKRVGHIDYCINPLRDRLYIDKIEIYADYRRRGFALSALWQLWQKHYLPIVPLYQFGTSDGFWHKARTRFAAADAVIGDEIRGSMEMSAEMDRWQHLVPEPIHERLQRELMASDEWPAIKAKWDAEYGPCRED
ncbi:N-acetyltransferase [Pseudomonas syringae]|uniref:Uncharacterized protein n=1 Tax=Pseudomonas syringae pv. aptata TaxID=83167 RepID=A0A0Q0CY46_PSEAP|nr:N-acetyltransferase [Pseudomonas syringae]KPY99085.1 hypothetical protein ALO85_100685 [Pseudomonas syringae pv. aptata]RMO63408.1 hypothetical protein ALQ37_101087 [Pseudomonas syringae pv. aptata]